MSCAVVIPSRTTTNAARCIEAVRRNERHMPIVLVWDKSNNNPEQVPEITRGGVDVIEVDHPFCFAKNVNIGIRAIGDLSPIILGDDGLLMTAGGFTDMAIAAEKNPEYGVISASISGFVGNRNQQHTGIGGLRDEPRMVCFIAALIPRRVIEKVGLLDEDFVGYGADDDEMCLRARRAGYKIGVFDGCIVEHGTLPSTFRSRPDCGVLFQQNMELFKRKFGATNHQL